MAEKGWQCSAGLGAGRVTVPRAGDTSATCTPTGNVDSADTEHGGEEEREEGRRSVLMSHQPTTPMCCLHGGSLVKDRSECSPHCMTLKL